MYKVDRKSKLQTIVHNISSRNIAHFPQRLPVNEFWNWVKIWRRCGQKFAAYFLAHPVQLSERLRFPCIGVRRRLLCDVQSIHADIIVVRPKLADAHTTLSRRQPSFDRARIGCKSVNATRRTSCKSNLLVISQYSLWLTTTTLIAQTAAAALWSVSHRFAR